MSERAPRAWATSYRASRVLPVSAPPIRDGAVVVEDGRIVWVGRAGDEPSLSGKRVVELGRAVLAPGLVNAHTHLDLTVMSGLLDGLPFFEWIRAVVACRDALTPDELLDSARAGIISGLEAGVTTYADTAPVAAPFDAMLELGVRGIAYQEVFGPDPAEASAASGALDKRVALLCQRESRLVRVGVSPHAPYSVSDELFVAVAALARRKRLPIATHVAESDAESTFIVRGAGPFAEFLRGRGIGVAVRADSPVALLERLGVLGADVLLVHCVTCDDRDVAAVARGGAGVATCPRSNSYFAHGRAPVAAFRRAGVAVGVGSDSMASNVSMDPLLEAAAALAGDAGSTAADRWNLATLGGARALGLDATIGTLEAGKDADMVAFPLGAAVDDAAAYPDLPPSARASLVLVAGVERVRDGRVVGDTGAVAARAAAAALRLRKWRTRAASA